MKTTTTNRHLAWHFVGETLRDGRPVPSDGEWLTHDGELALFQSGLHAAKHPSDALRFAPGPVLCRVEVDGAGEEAEGLSVYSRRRILWRYDMTKELLIFGCWCVRNTPITDGRRVWDLTVDPRSRHGVRASTAFALGQASAEDLASAWEGAWWAADHANAAYAWAVNRNAAWKRTIRSATLTSTWAAAKDAAWAAAWITTSENPWIAAWTAAQASVHAAKNAAWTGRAKTAWDSAGDAAVKAQRAQFEHMCLNLPPAR